ncbi:hypothetical protein Clocl_1777 [Acetivibrio clariflavus DSM 19732]|uniref:Uncharacterized protein n=1 Tax=Acetivibrio clariflavus (strain DSM 19732 / NBRC 101661 / EBR45) TaxID=720554 RepID=G8LTZ8_ACECE|nr:hypothetical protein Clocl_1777 [Acetivibrio clariflavus DSM 19732]
MNLRKVKDFKEIFLFVVRKAILNLFRKYEDLKYSIFRRILA